MNSDEKIWNIAKWRFLQSEASLWIINNKIIEFIFLVGFIAWMYFEFFSSGHYSYIKYIGLVLVFFSLAAISVRCGNYYGFFDGYERGFKDAAVRNLDYWGDSHSELSDESIVNEVLKDIDNNEEQVSLENKASRNKEVKQGFSKLVGLLLTWKKLQ